MMSIGRACRVCGAPLRRGYSYCNHCGERVDGPGETVTTAKRVDPPVILPRKKGGGVRGSPVYLDRALPRREMVLLLLGMTCMAPLCIWEGVLGGSAGTSAVFGDEMYGRYVPVLAAGGLLAILAERRLGLNVPWKAIIPLIGLLTVGLTITDYADMYAHNASASSGFLRLVPGIGMYLAVVLGCALILAVLVPERGRAVKKVSGTPVRPGSQGSAPSIRR